MSYSATRKAIADAAAQEFLSHGYAGASLSRIAQRIGLTKGALAYHFRAKADFAAYLVGVVRDATDQAAVFSRDEFPNSGARHILLHILLMKKWKEDDPQIAAGLALFADRACPAFEAESLMNDWLTISTKAFESCRDEGDLDPAVTPLDASEMLLITYLGVVFFAKNVRPMKANMKSMRFVRLALHGMGISDIDQRADAVIDGYHDRLPAFKYQATASRR